MDDPPGMRVRRGFLGKGLAECLVIACQPRIFRRTLKKSVAQPRVVGFASRLLAEGPRVAPTLIGQQYGLPLAVALMGDLPVREGPAARIAVQPLADCPGSSSARAMCGNGGGPIPLEVPSCLCARFPSSGGSYAGDGNLRHNPGAAADAAGAHLQGPAELAESLAHTPDPHAGRARRHQFHLSFSRYALALVSHFEQKLFGFANDPDCRGGAV